MQTWNPENLKIVHSFLVKAQNKSILTFWPEFFFWHVHRIYTKEILHEFVFCNNFFCCIKNALNCNYNFVFYLKCNWIKLFVGSTYFPACSLQNRFPEIYDIKEHMDVTAEAICSIMTKVEMAKDIQLHMRNVFLFDLENVSPFG